MQVFKAFTKIGIKRAPAVLLYLIIFGVLAILMGSFSSSSPVNSFSTTSLSISVVDLDQSKASHALITYLDSKHEVTIVADQTELLLDKLYYRQTAYILRIPKGFEHNLLQNDNTSALLESINLPNSYNAVFVEGQLNSFIHTLSLYLNMDYSITDAISQTFLNYQNTTDSVEMTIVEDSNVTKDTVATYYFQYLPYILLAMLISGLTPLLTTFRSKDLDARIRCSSLSHTSRNLQLMFGCICYSVLNWMFVIAMGLPLYKKYISNETFLLNLGNAFALLLVCVSITLFVSSFSPKENVLSMISNILSLGMSFLCGIFVPQALLGEQVLSVSKFLPFYWYVKTNNMISSIGNEPFILSTYWKNTGILLLFALALMAMTLVSMKQQASK